MAFLEVILFLIFFSQNAIANSLETVDIVIFSPHPDDGILCCGGKIAKEARAGKKIKIVFLTNGEAYSDAIFKSSQKEKSEITTKDYKELGNVRQKEAIEAGQVLGLKKEDLIFLGYPDGGLFSLVKENYKDYYFSPFTLSTSSPYENTFRFARYGYTKLNIILDLKEILRNFRPKQIFLPHPLDRHRDHRATHELVFAALGQLQYESGNDWLSSLEIFYYLIHNPRVNILENDIYSWPNKESEVFEEPPLFSHRINVRERTEEFKNQKAEALKKYKSVYHSEEKLFDGFLNKKEEVFWKISKDKKEKLKDIKEEWKKIGEWLSEAGYNINFGPVADLNEDTDDKRFFLNLQERIFSSDPEIVADIVEAIVDVLNEKGIIPIVKHFPVEGRIKIDPHLKLSVVNLDKKIFLKEDLLPYKRLIEKKKNFWIMVGHTVFATLDEKNPASLSFEIQTEFLRKELGFEGIIITDDLGQMGAIKEYANKENLKFPYHGEVVKRAFKAGSDIVILYLPSLTEIEAVIDEIKNSIEKGELQIEDIDASVERILLVKERIFKKPFRHLLKEMSIEEKIAQKILVDIWNNSQINVLIKKKYPLGGIRIYDLSLLEKIKKAMKIPPFLAAQHEGGMVYSHDPLIFTRSAYIVGKEFEGFKVKPQIYSSITGEEDEESLNFYSLSKFKRSKILKSILFLLEREKERIGIECIGYCYLFEPDSGLILRLVSFGNLPPEWREHFTEVNMSYIAYSLLKNLYLNWLEKEKLAALSKSIEEQLDSFIEYFKKFVEKEGKFRVLVLATHPDDEDQIAISYFNNEGADVYLLVATRGEGGENRINSLTSDDLGRLRTEEVERAGEILGIKKIYYLGAKDFGYCVDEKEAWKHWNKKELLQKIVYFYRLIKPHIIITKDNLTEHCQHKAFLSLALQAFDLSSNDKFYTRLKKEGILPWQPLEFYQRATEENGVLVINSQEKNVFFGKTYQEISIEALKQHKSQGADRWPIQFEGNFAYTLVKSQKGKENLELKEDLALSETLPSGVPGIKISKRNVGLYEPNNNILFVNLSTLGYDVSRLKEVDLWREDLTHFDVIIIGQLSPPLSSMIIENLMNFLNKGGTLIVFPQFDLKEEIFKLAPFPFKIVLSPIGENGKIDVLKKDHKLFRFPNKISLKFFKKFKGKQSWYFPREYGKEYEELIQIKNIYGENIKSGILVSKVGQGKYIFTGLDWYSLLRNYHEEALKMLANMVSF